MPHRRRDTTDAPRRERRQPQEDRHPTSPPTGAPEESRPQRQRADGTRGHVCSLASQPPGGGLSRPAPSQPGQRRTKASHASVPMRRHSGPRSSQGDTCREAR